MTAAIIAGNPPEHRIARLRQFWQTATTDPTPAASFWFGVPDAGVSRQAHNQARVLETLFLGRPGIFRPHFDRINRATLAGRWRAGEDAMRAVLQTLGPAGQGQEVGSARGYSGDP